MPKSFWICQDLLLSLASFLFLIPVNPFLSSIPVIVWLFIQFFSVRINLRWVAWPCFFILAIYSPNFIQNLGPHPASAADAVLFVLSALSACFVSRNRFPILLRLQLLVIPLIIFNLGPKPWSPNPLVGANQGGYLLGLLCLISLAWFFAATRKSLLVTGFSAFLTAASLLLVWNTGSRASFLSVVAAVSLFWILRQSSVLSVSLKLVTIFCLGVLGLVVKQFLSPSSFGLPGVDLDSDFGRLLIAKCYAYLPFSGQNRFLFGIGFDHSNTLCSKYLDGNVVDHAHNIFLQIFANTGIFGVVGLLVLIASFGYGLIGTESVFDSFTSNVARLSFFYVSVQGCLDVSVLHWPTTIVITGLLLGILLAQSKNISMQHEYLLNQ